MPPTEQDQPRTPATDATDPDGVVMPSESDAEQATSNAAEDAAPVGEAAAEPVTTTGSATAATVAEPAGAKAKKSAKDAQAKANAASRREELRRQQEATAAKRRRNRMFLVGGAVLAAIALLVAIVFVVQYTSRSLKSEPEHASPQGDSVVVAPDKTKDGVKNVALYTDFQCPYCKKFEDKYGAELVRLAEAGDIRLEMHTMTFLDGNIAGDNSLRAARASGCATQVGKYVDYFRTVYAHQPTKEGEGYTDDQLRKQFAEEAGISGGNLDKFQKCYDGKSLDGWYKSANEKNMKTLMDSSNGGRWGTPALLVNGKMADFEALSEGQEAFSASPEKIKVLIDQTK